MKHWGPAAGSGTPQDDAQRAALSVLQNFDDSLEEDTFDVRISSRSRSSPDMFGEPKTRDSLSDDEELGATTPVSTSTALSAEAEAEAEAEATAAAPLVAAGAWLATLPPRVIVEAPSNGLAVASSTADDEGAGSDFVVRSEPSILPVLVSLTRCAHVAVRRSGGRRRGSEPAGGTGSRGCEAAPHGGRLCHGRGAAHMDAGALIAGADGAGARRALAAARGEPGAGRCHQRAGKAAPIYSLSANQPRADDGQAGPSPASYPHPHQVQLQLAEEARAAGGGGGGGGGTGTGTAAEASAGDKAAEAHVNALARISELEEVVGGHAAALEAERASVATLQRQLEAQGGEVACLTQQLQGSILQSIERSNAQLSSQRKRGAR